MIQRNPAIQFASSDKIKVWQEERLQEELIYLQEHSPFYSGLFRRAGVDPTAIRRIEELQQLAESMTGVPKPIETGDKVVCMVEYRDGSVVDVIRQIKK